MSEKVLYGKRESSIIAGIAILLMLCSHFFYRPILQEGNDWIPIFSIKGFSIIRALQPFGDVCVSLFAFNSGYILYKAPEKYKYGRGLAIRALKFLTLYWICCAIFLFLGAITNSPMPTREDLIFNLFGIYAWGDFVAVFFAWYVTYYLFFLLIAYCMWKILAVKNIYVTLFNAFLLMALFSKVSFFGYIWPIYPCILGVLAAKYSLLEYIYGKVSKFNIPITLLCIMMLIVLRDVIPFGRRSFNITFVRELIVVILFIPLFLNVFYRICKTKYGNRIERSILFLSSVSLPLWFVHGIFFTKLPFQWILFLPKVSVLIYIWGLLICIPMAMIINMLNSKLWSGFRTMNSIFLKV